MCSFSLSTIRLIFVCVCVHAIPELTKLGEINQIIMSSAATKRSLEEADDEGDDVGNSSMQPEGEGEGEGEGPADDDEDEASKDADAAAEPAAEAKKSNHVARKLKARGQARALDQALDDQFATGRLYASIASRPGQCGRADGYILEGKELEFYVKKMQRKKSKA